ncbi:hypothetical protein [Wolbachia endosymbiont (group A) of Andrena bucephala]|uniref:hypothetical protein n=1 Tax=Wolbachia endosymbiont (group A) of Andrena bucephala TaxID=3066189 RepID=UPI00313356B0
MIVSVIAAEALLHNTIPKEHKVKREFLFGFTDFICSGLLKSVLNAKIISDDSLIYTPLTYAILCKNSKAIKEILKVSKNLS